MAVKAVREGFHTVTPYLMVREPEQLVDFVKAAFGAVETYRAIGGKGGFHIEVLIGTSMVMIGGGGKWEGEPVPAALFLYLEDVDTVYASALKAGATSIMEPNDRPEGDRLSGVQDHFGNTWYIATHIEDKI